VRRIVAALALAASLAAPAGAAPSPAPPAMPTPDSGSGRAYAKADPGAMTTGVELRIDAGLDRQTDAQNGLAALVAEAVLRTPVAGGLDAAGAADAAGASIRYAVDPQGVRFYLDGTPASVAAATPAFAAALAAPSFSAATLAASRRSLDDRIGDEESDARAVGRAMLRASYYRGGAGFPAYGTTGSLTAFGTADAQAFYAAWYRRGNALAVAAGRTGAASDAASRALLGALPAGSAVPASLATKPFGAQPRRIVTHRDVGAPYVVLGFAAPGIGSRDFAAALVVRSLLTGVLEVRSAATVSPLLRASGTFYGYESDPAQLVVWINGARLDAEVGLAAVDAVVKAAASKPVSAQVLERYKTTARGVWVLEAVGVDERAAAAANAIAHGLGPDGGDAIADAIARVTAADVQRVAKTYFQKFDVALILPRGNGS